VNIQCLLGYQVIRVVHSAASRPLFAAIDFYVANSARPRCLCICSIYFFLSFSLSFTDISFPLFRRQVIRFDLAVAGNATVLPVCDLTTSRPHRSQVPSGGAAYLPCEALPTLADPPTDYYPDWRASDLHFPGKPPLLLPALSDWLPSLGPGAVPDPSPGHASTSDSDPAEAGSLQRRLGLAREALRRPARASPLPALPRQTSVLLFGLS
jgi:hypothetical protein